MSDNGKTPEQIKREEFEADPKMFVHRRDIILAAVKGANGKIDKLINGENIGLLKAAAFDLPRVVSNICNSMEMQQAKKNDGSKVVPANQKSMAEIQRGFKNRMR